MNKKVNRKIEAGLVIAIMVLVTTTSITVEAEKEGDFFTIWEKTWGREQGNCSVESAFSIDLTDIGTDDWGYIMAGRTSNPNWTDIWLIKTDKNGEEDWNSTIGESEAHEEAFCVQQTDDGGYIVTGRKTYDYDKMYWSLLLTKTGTDGEEDWNKTWDAPYGAGGNCVQQTDDGGYIITGAYQKSIRTSSNDLWLIKTDADGDEEWKVTLWSDGEYADWGNCVQQTDDGGYIVTGIYGEESIPYLTQCWLIKISPDTEGEIQWDKKFGEIDFYDEGHSVKQTDDGGYIISGQTTSYGHLSVDAWLVKTDADGNLSDMNFFGGDYRDIGYSVDICPPNEGWTEGYIMTGQWHKGNETDVYVVKTYENLSLEAEYIYDFGLNETDVGRSVRVTPFGDYVIAGWTDIYYTNLSHRDQDLFLLRLRLYNQKPEPPAISGPNGKAGKSYDYNFTAIDPEGDDVYYYIDWNDSSFEDWFGPYPSGEEITVNHTWDEKGTYTIKAKAKDIYGAESDWGTLEVEMPIKKDEGCIVGTQITMASGFPSTKPIEDIEAEEFILSYDPISQVTTIAEVIEVYEFTENPPLTFNGNLEITSSHTLYINGSEWMEADDAQIGYYMLGNTPGTSETYPVNVSSKEPSTGPAGPIYDLVIQPVSGEACGYFADGILVGGYD